MHTKNPMLAALAVALFTGPVTVQAQYNYELIDHPGAAFTQVFGNNEKGDVAGTGVASPTELPFVFDSKKGTYTDIATLPGFDGMSILDINNAGDMVGSAFDANLLTNTGFILDKNGNYSLFSHPDALSSTNPRAVNEKGLVSGFRDRPDFGTPAAFIYDSKKGTFTDIIPEAIFSIAHGINSRGDVVGSSFFFPAADPCGNGPGLVSYSWLRTADGAVTYFNVNGLRTRARGINDSGSITGFVLGSGPTRGFVIELDGSQCQTIDVADEDLLEFPGYDTQPYGITNSGDIVGLATEEVDGGAGFVIHGFIATPQ